MAASTVAIAFISFGVWAHHMFAVGMSRTVDIFFAAASLVAGIRPGCRDDGPPRGDRRGARRIVPGEGVIVSEPERRAYESMG